MQAGPTQEWQHESLVYCATQESLEKEEELEEVDLGSGSQGPRPILISASLTEKEKSELMLLLKEFKDVFE